MSLVSLDIPPGLYMNGTPYDQKNRWADGDLVRWHNGSMRPIGGWIPAVNYVGTAFDALTATPATEIYRDAFSWTDNNNTRYTVFGSNTNAKVVTEDGVFYTITPAGFTGSSAAPTIATGYGTWLFGRSPYGAARPINPSASGNLWRWGFDTWGEDLIIGPADPENKDGLYVWDTDTPGTVAQPITNAPTDCNGFIVTNERVVMTIGSTDEARMVRWCDRENYDDWTPTDTNWAGFQYLTGRGRLLSISKVLDDILILSENDAYVGRFIRTPYIYGFDFVGRNCGPWNGQVVQVTNRLAMWPGIRQFWAYDGTLQPVECPIMDWLDADIDYTQLAKAHSLTIPSFTEIWWFYQSKSGSDVDSYVAYDYVAGTWQKGRLSRTCGISGEVYVSPKMVDASGVIYEHERSDVLVENTYATTGPLEVGRGGRNMAISRVFPDVETYGDVSFQFTGRQMPTEAQVTSSVYSFANPTNVQFLAREIQMKIIGAARGWQVGQKMRLEVAFRGTGRR